MYKLLRGLVMGVRELWGRLGVTQQPQSVLESTSRVLGGVRAFHRTMG